MLFAPTAHLLDDSWVLSSDKRKTDLLLNGVTIIDFQLTSVMLFFRPLSIIHLPTKPPYLITYCCLFPPSFVCMYIFFCFRFSYFTSFFFFFLRFVCVLLLNFVIRHNNFFPTCALHYNTGLWFYVGVIKFC